MRAITVLTLAAVLLGAGICSGGMHIGLGVMAGEPTGLSLKAWSDGRHAVDAAAGWSLGDEGWFYVHADYLWHSYDFDPGDLEGTLPWYVGVGGRARLKDGDDSEVGVRIPVGLDYVFKDLPLDVFIEVAPIFDLVPDTDYDVSGGIGIRYYF